MRVLCCWNGWGIVQKCAGKLPVERICPVFGVEPGIRNRRGKATKKAFAISRKGLLSFGSPRRTWTANLVINSHLKSLFRVTSAHKNLFNYSIINTNLFSQKLTFAHRSSHSLAQNWRKIQGHFFNHLVRLPPCGCCPSTRNMASYVNAEYGNEIQS